VILLFQVVFGGDKRGGVFLYVLYSIMTLALDLYFVLYTIRTVTGLAELYAKVTG